MKIIVCVSGAIPTDSQFEMATTIEENLYVMKRVLPDADYVFTTWDDQPHSLLTNKRYKVPPMTYNPAKGQIQHDINRIRKLRAGDEEETKKFDEFVVSNINTKEELMHQMLDTVGKRTWFRTQQKQLIIHSLTCRDFVKDDHDVVIRMRYDTVIDEGFFKRWVFDLCKLCYDERRPIGFHRYPRTGSQIYSQQPIMEFTHTGQGVDSHLCRDFMIIHRADMCDYKIIDHLYAHKTLSFSEPGWHQLLCEPYTSNAIMVNLPITLSKLAWFENEERNKEGSGKKLSELISSSYSAL
jgi:hypothetical protein